MLRKSYFGVFVLPSSLYRAPIVQTQGGWSTIFRTGILLIAVFFLAAMAHATPVTFSLQNGTFASGATISGTVVIDTTAGTLVSADLTYTLGGSSVTFDRAFYAQGMIPALYTVYFPLTYGDVVDGPGSPTTSPTVDDFGILLPVFPLVDYTGGPICTFSSYYCGGGISSEYAGRTSFPGIDYMLTGSLVSSTVTPEPSEFALTLTGMALCFQVGIGRFRRAQSEPTTVS